jgi:transposase
MGYGYSIDLRERVVTFYEQGGATERDTAALFGVGEATVRRWRRLKRETGSLAAKPVGGGAPARVQGEGELIVCGLVIEQPDRTIEELTDAFGSMTGGPISTSSMSRALARLGLSRKKKPSRTGTTDG